MKHCKTFQDLNKTLNNNEICKLNLSDSWDGPLKFIECLIEWFFTLIEPKYNLIKLDLYEFKRIASHSTDFNEHPVFFLQKNKNKIIKCANINEINLILFNKIYK